MPDVWENYKTRNFVVSDPDARLRDPGDLTKVLMDAAGEPRRIPRNERVTVRDVKTWPTSSTSKGIYALAVRDDGQDWGWTSARNFKHLFANVTIGLIKPAPGAGKFGPNAVWESGAYKGQADLVMIVDSTFVIEAMTLELLDPYIAMTDQAAADGVDAVLNSGFRSYPEQKVLYDGFVKKLPGYAKAAKPGSSPHQNGIAVDIAVGGAASGPTYDWLAANATSYGFIRTVKSEPWHWEHRPGPAATARGHGKHTTW